MDTTSWRFIAFFSVIQARQMYRKQELQKKRRYPTAGTSLGFVLTMRAWAPGFCPDAVLTHV